MITYIISHRGHFLRETLALVTAPPQACPASPGGQTREHSQSVTVGRTSYLVRVNGTVHKVRRDRACDCGGTPDAPCPAIPLVLDYLAAGGPRPLGRHEDTWPENWLTVPPLCPICDCPTIPDRYVDSSHGPGWRCTLDPLHYWQIRLNPLRRYLAAHPPPPTYPWYDASPAQRQAWLEAHYAPPRLVPSEGGNQNALDRTPPSQSSAITMPPYV